MQGDRNAIPGGKRHVGSRGSNDLSQARSTSTTDQAISPLRRCLIEDVVSTPRPGSLVLARLQDHPGSTNSSPWNWKRALPKNRRVVASQPQLRCQLLVRGLHRTRTFRLVTRDSQEPAKTPRLTSRGYYLPASRDLANRRFAIVAEVSEG
jgi:hypothetical protein